MLGLGEEEGEVVEAMGNLRSVDLGILNLGLYRRSGRTRLPSASAPGRFDRLRPTKRTGHSATATRSRSCVPDPDPAGSLRTGISDNNLDVSPQRRQQA
jgi:hypothetical protein